MGQYEFFGHLPDELQAANTVPSDDDLRWQQNCRVEATELHVAIALLHYRVCPGLRRL